MALLIENNQNVFSVKGMIDQFNAEILKRYILSQFDRKKDVVVDINRVKEIDRKGVKMFGELNQLFSNKKSNFFIVGFGCKEIYDELLTSA